MSKDGIEELFESLVGNVGRVVTVFTQSGGATGCGFTGLLVSVNCEFLKLITKFPTAPTHPFGMNIGHNNLNCNRGREELGTAIIIPLSKIVSVVFNEV